MDFHDKKCYRHNKIHIYKIEYIKIALRTLFGHIRSFFVQFLDCLWIPYLSFKLSYYYFKSPQSEEYDQNLPRNI